MRIKSWFLAASLLVVALATGCTSYGYRRVGYAPRATVYAAPQRGAVYVAPQRGAVYVAPQRSSTVYVSPPPRSRGTVVVTPPSRGRGTVVVTPPSRGGVVVTRPR